MAGNNNGGRNRRPKQASIDQVASRAGVSTATVSRVLNNPSLVTPATAKRVEEAIAELRYRPNMFAKGLMMRRSRVLALVLPDIHGEFYSELLRVADGRAHELGYHLLASSRSPFEDSEEVMPFAFGLLDGVVLMLPTGDRRALEHAARLDAPLVLVELDGSNDGFDSILIDNAPGARAAIEHILESVPPEQCIYVGGEEYNADTEQRVRAFTETLRARGHEPQSHQIVFGSFDSAHGESWANTVGPEVIRGAGIVSGNDEIAFGVMSAASAHNLRAPDDFRIVGFDNSRLSALVRPRLSSVRIPLGQIAEQAVSMLVERIEQEDDAEIVPPRVVRMATELVVRETS
ncbi:MAG: LacI family DNA-binding transcriptional regulator [Planctomycetota bacterium]